MMFRWICAALTLLLAVSTAYAAPRSATDKIIGAFMDLDGNHSGSVSYSEYKAMVNRRANERFRQMDANRNGEVSEDEYRSFWRKRKSEHYRLNR